MAPTPWGRSAPQPKTCGGAIIFAPPHKRMTVHSARRAPSWIYGEREGRGRVGKGGKKRGCKRRVKSRNKESGRRKGREMEDGMGGREWARGMEERPILICKSRRLSMCCRPTSFLHFFAKKKLACNSQATTHKGGIGLHDGRSQLSDCCHYALGRCKRTYSPCY